MSQSFLNIFLTTALLLFMGGTFLFFWMRSLEQGVKKTWTHLLENLNARLDKIPLLLEIVKKATAGEETLINEAIRLRAQSHMLEQAGNKKVHIELSLSDNLHRLWELTKKYPQLERDTLFLALQKEFETVQVEIEQILESYNQQVRHYNNFLKFIFLKPFFLLFRFKKMQIFEFES
jgi:hypothetical protein